MATTNADVSPHAAGVGTLLIDGVLCLISGVGNPHVAEPRPRSTLRAHRVDAPIPFVVEATARVVTDRTRLERMAEV